MKMPTRQLLRVLSQISLFLLLAVACPLGTTHADLLLLDPNQPANPVDTSDPEPIDLTSSLFVDSNGDGVVTVVAFGDSITRGVGDTTDFVVDDEFVTLPTSEAGYPLRLENLLGISVLNFGNPGETLIDRGLARFAETVPGQRADVVFISGGSNDAFFRGNASDFYKSVQTMINIASASGSVPVLVTTPPVCCDHESLAPFVDAFNQQFAILASVNNIPLANTYRAFRSTCEEDECRLLHRPEGLHPDPSGFDVMSEAVLAAAFQVDLFAPEGPALLEELLRLAPGSIKTRPDTVPTQ